MSDWQPIETAPKDETVVLIWADGPWIAFFNRRTGQWDDGDFFDSIDEATHWMPIPEPPKEKPMTDLKTDWERRADIEAEERRMKQIAEADALAEIQRLGQEIDKTGKKP